jgi:hypothetical protein
MRGEDAAAGKNLAVTAGVPARQVFQTHPPQPSDRNIMPRRLPLLLACLLLPLAAGGCHVTEAVSYEIEDASAYSGQKIAEGGEHFAEWMRKLSER